MVREGSRWRLVVVVAASCGAVLTGCSGLGRVSPPAATDSSAHDSVGPDLVAVNTEGPVAPAGGLAAVGTDPMSTAPVPAAHSCVDPANGGVVESAVWVPAGDHRVPGTLALPTAPGPGLIPTVLMLHGDLSNRNEGAGLFAREAAALAEHGIGSLRIDFAGSGDSEEPDLALDYPGMVTDATAAVRYLQADPGLDPTRVAVLGMSRGGAIAATLAGTVPGVAALAEWSGAVYDAVDDDPTAHDQARIDGFYPVDLGGGRSFRLSLNWFDTIEQSHPLADVTGYTGPVLAVTGSADETVPPEVSDVLVNTVASTDTTRHIIDGADHGFDDTSPQDETHSQEALTVTTDWLASRLGTC